MMEVSHRSVDTLRGYVRRVDLFREHAGPAFLRVTRLSGCCLVLQTKPAQRTFRQDGSPPERMATWSIVEPRD